jgi:hypothetical protein
VSVAEKSAPVAESLSIRSRVSHVLPVAGIGLALIVNAACVASLAPAFSTDLKSACSMHRACATCGIGTAIGFEFRRRQKQN